MLWLLGLEWRSKLCGPCHRCQSQTLSKHCSAERDGLCRWLLNKKVWKKDVCGRNTLYWLADLTVVVTEQSSRCRFLNSHMFIPQRRAMLHTLHVHHFFSFTSLTLLSGFSLVPERISPPVELSGCNFHSRMLWPCRLNANNLTTIQL